MKYSILVILSWFFSSYAMTNQESVDNEAIVNTKVDPGLINGTEWDIVCEPGKFLNNDGTSLSCKQCSKNIFRSSYASVNIDGAPDHLKHHKCCSFPTQVVCMEMMKQYKDACDDATACSNYGGQCVPSAEWLGGKTIDDAMKVKNCFNFTDKTSCEGAQHTVNGNDGSDTYCWWSTASPTQQNNKCKENPSTPLYCGTQSNGQTNSYSLKTIIGNYPSGSITNVDQFCKSLDPNTCNDYSAQGGGYGTGGSSGGTNSACCQVVA